MSKLPIAPGGKHIAAFKRDGWVVDRIEGSHHILIKEGHPHHLSIPVHKGKDIDKYPDTFIFIKFHRRVREARRALQRRQRLRSRLRPISPAFLSLDLNLNLNLSFLCAFCGLCGKIVV